MFIEYYNKGRPVFIEYYNKGSPCSQSEFFFKGTDAVQ